jgi:hypothetical protein
MRGVSPRASAIGTIRPVGRDGGDRAGGCRDSLTDRLGFCRIIGWGGLPELARPRETPLESVAAGAIERGRARPVPTARRSRWARWPSPTRGCLKDHGFLRRAGGDFAPTPVPRRNSDARAWRAIRERDAGSGPRTGGSEDLARDYPAGSAEAPRHCGPRRAHRHGPRITGVPSPHVPPPERG